MNKVAGMVWDTVTFLRPEFELGVVVWSLRIECSASRSNPATHC